MTLFENLLGHTLIAADNVWGLMGVMCIGVALSGSVKYFSQKSLRGLARTKSASNGGVLRGDLQMIHVHVLLVAPLSTSYMTQSGTD